MNRFASEQRREDAYASFRWSKLLRGHGLRRRRLHLDTDDPSSRGLGHASCSRRIGTGAVIKHSREIAEEIDDAPVLLIVDDRTSVTLGAELLARGHDFACYSTLATMAVSVDAGSLGVPFVLVIDQTTLSERDRLLLAGLRATGPLAATILLGIGREDESGPWDRIVRQPTPTRAIADILDHVLRERSSSRQGSADAGEADLPGFEPRMGRPWPMIRCLRCGASTHCEQPRTTRERGLVRQEFMKFLLAHEHRGSRPRSK